MSEDPFEVLQVVEMVEQMKNLLVSLEALLSKTPRLTTFPDRRRAPTDPFLSAGGTRQRVANLTWACWWAIDSLVAHQPTDHHWPGSLLTIS